MLILNLHFISSFQPLIPLSGTTAWVGGTTASVLPLWWQAVLPLQYRPNTVRGLFERNFGRYLTRYYHLNCFFRFSSLSGTSGLVPLQYRFNTVRVLFERNFDRYLDRYFRFSSFYSFSPLSGTYGPVPLRYRRQLHTGGTWPGTWTGTSTSSGTTVGVGGTTAQYWSSLFSSFSLACYRLNYLKTKLQITLWLVHWSILDLLHFLLISTLTPTYGSSIVYGKIL